MMREPPLDNAQVAGGSLSQHSSHSSSPQEEISEALGAVPPPDPPFLSKTSLIQLGYGVLVSLNPTSVGFASGYTAVAIPMLQKDSELKLTESQLSWFASVLTLASPAGCLVVGLLIDRFGRRIGLMLSEVPMIVGWIVIDLASSPTHLILGRAVTGIGVGMIMPAVRVYNSEISLPNMRGVLGVVPNLAISIGLTVQAVLGMFLGWRHLSRINCFMSAFLLAVNMLLPETPYFILMTGTEENAEKNLRKFRSHDYDHLDAEIKQLIKFKHKNEIRNLTMREKLVALMKPATCKPFSIIMIYCFFTQLSGISVIWFWTIIILQKSKSSYDPEMGNTLMATTRIFASVLGAVIVYFWKRRTVTFLSGIGIGVAFLCTAFNYMLAEKPSIVPQITLMMCAIFACLGWYSIPMLMMSEMYPLQVRGILGGLTLSLLNLTNFGGNMIFLQMLNNWGFQWTIMQYGIWALVGVIALYFILPETKDFTLQEIEEHYNKKGPSLFTGKKP